MTKMKKSIKIIIEFLVLHYMGCFTRKCDSHNCRSNYNTYFKYINITYFDVNYTCKCKLQPQVGDVIS